MRFRVAVALVVIACSNTPPDDSPRWVRVARDANYTIYIDTGRLAPYEVSRAGPRDTPREYGKPFDVWYRTDHALPRIHDADKQLFNREVVHSIITCDSLRFRVASVDMSMGSKKPIAQQRLTENELRHQVWRRVEMGTAEEMAARAACHFAGVPGK